MQTRGLLSAIVLLTGCAANQHHQPPTPTVVEAPPVQAPAPVAVVVPPSDAEFLAADSPEVQEAFDKYIKTGKAPVIAKKTSGFVQWPFGLSQPTARCRPLEACRIELEPGEIVRSVGVGDQERWVIPKQPIYSGPDNLITTHIMIKPTDELPNMETTLTIGTDRRVYEIRLISRQQGAIVRAKFYYPEDMLQMLNDMPEKKPKPAPSIDMAKIAATRTQYTLEGDEELFPSLIGNDDDHTYFLMPTSLHTINAPVLYELSPRGERTQINYRLVNSYYMADKLLNRAVLVWNVGRDERVVTITREYS